MIEQQPSWLHVDRFVDIKSKQDGWKVGYVLDSTKNQVRIRMDGWSNKLDEWHYFTSNRLKPFRSIVRGYTGQKKYPALRDHWKFQIEQHMNKLQKFLLFQANLFQYEPEQITQYLRGHHYFYMDFLMTRKFTTLNEIQEVYNYFKKHIDFTLNYLQQFTQTQVPKWFAKNTEKPQFQAYAQGYFQYFDAIYLMMGCQPRSTTFLQENKQLLNELKAQSARIIDYLGIYFTEIKFLQTLKLALAHIQKFKQYQLPIPFLRALLMLFFALDKIQSQKELKRVIYSELLQILKHQIGKITPTIVKNDQYDLQSIFSLLKRIFFLCKEKNEEQQQWLAISKLNVACMMILTDSLEKRLKGISRIKQLYEALIVPNQYQLYQLPKEKFKAWLFKQQLLQIIFEHNQHFQVVKKGCELSKLLYPIIIGCKQLINIWNACKNKHQAVRTNIQNLWLDLCLLIQSQDLQDFIRVVVDLELNSQWQIDFIFNFCEKIVKRRENIPIIEKLLDICYDEMLKNQSKISTLSQIIFKCNKERITKKSVEKCLVKIQGTQNSILHMRLLQQIISQYYGQKIYLPEDTLSIMIKQIKNILTISGDKIQQNLHFIFKLLNEIMLANQRQLTLCEEQFMDLWEMFSNLQNVDIKRTFYNWVLEVSDDGILHLRSYRINSNIDQELRVFIFRSILIDHKKLDYINMTKQQFIIFRQFMIEVNKLTGKLDVINHVSGKKLTRTNQLEIQGNRQLWSIFLNCKNEIVFELVSEFLRQLHLNFGKTMLPNLKISKLDELMTKLFKNIKQGAKKNNIRLIRHSLKLLGKIILQLKQEKFQIPKEFEEYLHIQNEKTTLTVYKDSEKNVYKIQIPFAAPLYEIKYLIAKHIGIQHDSFTLMINNQQVSRQLYTLPYFALSVHKNTLYIFLQENAMKKFVLTYVRQHLYDSLIQLLGNQNVSPDAFTILEELPFSEKDVKFLQANTERKDNLGQKSIYYNSYLLRVINSFHNYSLQSKIELLSRILQQFPIEITSFFSVQFCLNLIESLNKIIKQIKSHALNLQKMLLIVYNLMLSFLSYANKKQKPINEKDFKLFKEMFISLQICLDPQNYCAQHPKKSNKVLKFLLKQQRYKPVLNGLFIHHKFDFLKMLTCKKFSEYLENGILEIEQQQLLLTFFVIQTFPKVMLDHERMRIYPNFFKMFKIIIDGCSEASVAKLTLTKENETSFYQNILISAEKANYQTDNDVNPFLQGYLLLLNAFLNKFPQLITESLLNFILFNCLFFEEKYTEAAQIKCKHSQSISNCLSILNIICFQNAQYADKIYSTLIKYQTEITYWRTSDKWLVQIEEQKKSKTGYVGLENPGCICYLNSFMQQLFMMPNFRYKILELACDPKQENYELLNTLKLLFLKLQHSNEQYLSPLFFAKTIKNSNNKQMIRVFQQMDIDQYCAILLDKIQNLLPKNNNFVRKLFGGIYANEIISKECKHASQRQQMFLSVMLDVKKSILQSLQTLVEGETLEGQNAYFCENCNKKVKAVKRVCLKKLPDTLMISLRRIQFNFQIDAKIKINDYCQFPIQLDLTPYSYEKLHETTENADQQEMKEQKQQIRNEANYYHYKLKGVVVHTGYADSGHYYSFIEDRNDGKWYEFNDSKISQFDVSKLSQETFGGGGKDSEGNKIKNAYILIYQRQRPTQEMEIQTGESSHNSSLQISQAYNQEIINSIIAHNHIIEKYCVLFSKTYYQFISRINLFKNSQHKLSEQQERILMMKYKQCQITHFFNVKLRDKDVYQTLDYAEKIERVLEKDSLLCMDLLTEFSNPHIINQLFVYCSKAEKARIAAYLLIRITKNKLSESLQDELCPQIKSLIITLVKALVDFPVNNSKICFILRKLSEQNMKILELLYTLKIHQIILTNLSSSNTKQVKIQRLKTLNSFLDQITLKQSNIFGKHSQEKCTVSFRNIEKQAIHILYLLIGLKIPYKNILQELKISILNLEAKKITHIIEACNDTKSIIALATLIKEMIIEEWIVFDYIIKHIAKALKDYQSTKYRGYLVFLFELLQLNDHLKQQRSQKISNVIREALKANEKYYMEVDILLQWVLKMCSVSKQFLANLSDQKYVLQIMKYMNNQKAPTAQTLKKHKNPHCQRLLQRMHGIHIYSQLSDYQHHNRFKVSKFAEIYNNQFVPIPYLSEPDLKQQYVAGSDVNFWFQNRWFHGRVIQNQYGILKVQFISEHQNGNVYTQYIDEDSQKIKLCKEQKMELQ